MLGTWPLASDTSRNRRADARIRTADPFITSVPGAGVTLPPTTLATTTGKPFDLSLAKFGTLINPNTAQDIAGAQFDPQIAAAQLAVNEDPLQAAQNLTDIGSWYGQVGAAQQKAAVQDHAMTAAGTGSIGDIANALVQSLGGGANQGGSDVAGAGQNAAGTIAAIGNATDNYNTEIAPLIAAEGAEQKTNQSRLDTKQALADKTGLTSLQSAKGQAAQAALAQIEGENNSLAQARAQMAAQLQGENNALGQQGFANQLALSQSQIAALMNGLKIQGDSAKNTRATNPNAFIYATPTAKSNAQQSAIATLTQLQQKGTKLTPAQTRNIVANVYQGAGWNPSTPAVANAIGATLNVWNTGSGGV